MKIHLISFFYFASMVSSAFSAEIIVSVETLKGETFSNVKVLSRVHDTVKFMHADGVKTLKFSDLVDSSAAALGLGDYEKEVAGKELAEKQAKETAERQQQQKAQARERFVKNLRSKKNKEVFDWFMLAVLDRANTPEKLKTLLGSPPDFQSGDSLSWTRFCWNPVTEQMDDLWVENRTYRYSDSIYTTKSYVFRCGSKEFEMIHAGKYLENME